MTRRPATATATALAAALLLAVAATGCSRDDAAADADAAAAAEAPATAPADAATPAPAPGTDAVQLTDETSPVADGAAVEARELAGTFGNGDQKLVLAADGTYAFATTSPSAQAEVTEAGTWTLAGNGRDLLLDPDAKDDPDRAYQLGSRDELRGDGAPLRRAAED